jgi:hypothetical protein
MKWIYRRWGSSSISEESDFGFTSYVSKGWVQVKSVSTRIHRTFFFLNCLVSSFRDPVVSIELDSVSLNIGLSLPFVRNSLIDSPKMDLKSSQSRLWDIFCEYRRSSLYNAYANSKRSWCVHVSFLFLYKMQYNLHTFSIFISTQSV